MGLLDKRTERFEVKRAKIGFINETTDRYWTDNYQYLNTWRDDTPIDTSWSGLVTNLYQASSLIGSCMRVLVQSFPEPPPEVQINNEHRPDHPLQALLNRPNPLMSHAELLSYLITYRAVGGNAYLHKVRGPAGQVVELWPYHSGQMWPRPSRFEWVKEYIYDAGNGERRLVPAADVIHLKWPIIDLSAPWIGMSPLITIAREVLADVEATRFAHVLLKNNAIPSGIIKIPPGTPMDPGNAAKLRSWFRKMFGGENVGETLILEYGAEYERVGLNPTELDLSALRRVPEARVAGAFGMSPIIAHLTGGLDKSTYSNYEHAFRQYVQGTLVPLWRSDAAEWTQALSTDYSDSPIVTYNTSLVAALQESANEKFKRVLDSFDRNITLLDESRAMIDLPPLDQVLPGDQRGKLFSYEMQPPQIQQGRQIIDALVEEPPPKQIAQEGE